MKTMKKLGTGMVVSLAMVLSSTAMAEERCEHLGPEWDAQMQALTRLIQAERYDDAKVAIEKMEKICSRSPMLNYIEGRRRELVHDEEGAKKYFQRASESTYEFAVDPDLSKKIWYNRYEAENPENTKDVYQRMLEEREAAQTALNASETRIQEHLAAQLEEKDHAYRVGMWSGVGVGIAGLVMMGTGSGLIIGMDKKYDPLEINHKPKGDGQNTSDSWNSRQEYRIKMSYNVSLALVGAGVAATIVGATLAGVYGYKLTHLDDGMSFSLQIAPNAASFNMTF